MPRSATRSNSRWRRGCSRPGELVPSVRELSKQLVVNPNTVARAYRDLQGEGVLEPVRGTGLQVAAGAPEACRDGRREFVRRRLREALDEARRSNLALDEIEAILREEWASGQRQGKSRRRPTVRERRGAGDEPGVGDPGRGPDQALQGAGGRRRAPVRRPDRARSSASWARTGRASRRRSSRSSAWSRPTAAGSRRSGSTRRSRAWRSAGGSATCPSSPGPLRLDDRGRDRLVRRRLPPREPGRLGRIPARVTRAWSSGFDLPPKRKIKALSKGMRAKVGLALALASEPELLVLDEPTSGLDVLVRREFLESMVDLAGEGRTVLLSSHQIGEVERVASHVALLHQGKLVLAEPLDELKARTYLADLHPGRPRPAPAAGRSGLELIDADRGPSPGPMAGPRGRPVGRGGGPEAGRASSAMEVETPSLEDIYIGLHEAPDRPVRRESAPVAVSRWAERIGIGHVPGYRSEFDRSRDVAESPMLARLWWKEARVFGPIWLILGLAAAGLQWFLLSVRSRRRPVRGLDGRGSDLGGALRLRGRLGGVRGRAGIEDDGVPRRPPGPPAGRSGWARRRSPWSRRSAWPCCWRAWPRSGPRPATRPGPTATARSSGCSARSCSRRWPGACSGRRSRRTRCWPGRCRS